MTSLAVSFWRGVWRKARERSALRRSQETRPEAWLSFYEDVADVWLDIQGEPWRLGNEVARTLEENGVIGCGRSVLDLGCGPGTLAIPLARRGVPVTAVDSSPRMTARLRALMEQQGLRGVEVLTMDWAHLATEDRRSVGLAGCFPPAHSPEGIERLEDLSQLTCVVVMGSGQETFPFRKAIWKRLGKDPVPDARENLSFFLGYLTATKREPQVRRIEWSATLDMDASDVRRFYGRYFRMLEPECTQADIDCEVDNTIAPFMRDGRIRCEGPASMTVIWWSPHMRRPDEV